MKKIIKISLLAATMVCSLQAQNIEDRLNAIEKKLNIIEKDSNNEELESRIDEIETKTMLNKINFGLEMRTRVDNFNSKSMGGEDLDSNNVWSNKFKLNMDSKITDDMKFYGKISMFKNWADSGASYLYSNMDPMQGRRPSNSGLYVERAYVDWNVLKGEVPVTLTIGRQPSSDGPSHQFKDNTVRKATYSALSFDGAADGVVGTIGLSKLTNIDGMVLRMAYGKGYQDDTTYTYVGDAGSIKDSNVYGLFLDSGLGIENSLLQLSVVKANDVVSNIPNDNKNIGDVSLYTAMVEFSNIKDSGLDLFAHYGISISKPNGDYSLMDPSSAPGLTNPPLGLLTSTPGDIDDKKGHAFWLGTRYTLPYENLNNPKIGIEYNKGNENWFSFTQGSNSLTNKLATRGDAVEIYYIQPINRYAYLRTGFERISYDYTGSGYQIGAPLNTTEAASFNPYATKELNNFYLLFNITY